MPRMVGSLSKKVPTTTLSAHILVGTFSIKPYVHAANTRAMVSSRVKDVLLGHLSQHRVKLNASRARQDIFRIKQANAHAKLAQGEVLPQNLDKQYVLSVIKVNSRKTSAKRPVINAIQDIMAPPRAFPSVKSVTVEHLLSGKEILNAPTALVVTGRKRRARQNATYALQGPTLTQRACVNARSALAVITQTRKVPRNARHVDTDIHRPGSEKPNATNANLELILV